MRSFAVEVLTPEKALFFGQAESVTASAVDGSVEILAGHAQYINILGKGEVLVNTPENTCLHFKHNSGVLRVEKDQTSLLLH